MGALQYLNEIQVIYLYKPEKKQNNIGRRGHHLYWRLYGHKL